MTLLNITDMNTVPELVVAKFQKVLDILGIIDENQRLNMSKEFGALIFTETFAAIGREIGGEKLKRITDDAAQQVLADYVKTAIRDATPAQRQEVQVVMDKT